MWDVMLAAAAATSPAVPTGVGTDALLIGAVVALANALVEVGKKLASKRNGGRNGDLRCHQQVDKIHEVVCRTDVHGTPMVYGTHLVAEKLDRVADELAEVSAELKEKRHGQHD